MSLTACSIVPGGPETDEPPEVGSVHRATVKRIEAYGVFVALEGFRRHGLVHTSQVLGASSADLYFSLSSSKWLSLMMGFAFLGCWHGSVSGSGMLTVHVNNVLSSDDGHLRVFPMAGFCDVALVFNYDP